LAWAVLFLIAGAAAVATAQDKDTLVIALDTLGAQVMDPIADTRAPHAHYHAPIWDSLVGFDYDKGGIGPGVAERWDRSPDGKTWTFYLRRGQKFHNGDPVTAHDVKFSLERIMTPESISSGAAALRRAVDRIEVVDDLTVKVHTKGVIPHFAPSLSRAVFMEGSLMPKKYIEAVGTKGFREKPIGSGPWKFVRSVPGDRIEYEAVDAPHWRGTPQFKRMTLLLVPEQSTRLAMVRTGETAIASIGPDAIKEVRSGGMKVVTVPGTMQAIYQFWGLYRPEAKGSPLTDVRVREALSLAIDRQQIIDHVMAREARWPLPFTVYRYSIDVTIPRWED
jgi:peptide/nickel transport system substrate-binding protein